MKPKLYAAIVALVGSVFTILFCAPSHANLIQGPPPSGSVGGGPTPPSEASNAGFTTLAANYDFSTSTYANQSNWLDWANTDSSKPWHNGWPGGISGGGAFPATINQVTDPNTGQKVLDLQFPSSDASYGQTGEDNFVSIMTVMNGCSGSSACTGTEFPNMYVESVYRIDNTSSNTQNGIGPNGVWDWQDTSAGGNGPIELDYGELFGNSNGVGFSDSGWVNWGGGGGSAFFFTSYGSNNLPSGYDVTSYHKYGMLLTSDGSTKIYACSFVDDRLQACADTNASGQYTNRNFITAWVGGSDSLQVNEYLQYIRVWSCGSWSTGQCNGSSLYNSGGLTYWH